MREKFLTILLILFAFSIVSWAQEGAKSGPGKIRVQPVAFNTEDDTELYGQAERNSQSVPIIYHEEVEESKKEPGVVPIEALLGPTQMDPGVVNRGGVQPPASLLIHSFSGLNDGGIAGGGPPPLPTPPDCSIAVGVRDMMVATNAGVVVYNKDGTLLLQKTLPEWFSSALPSAIVFDPKILYDQQSSRYIFTAAAVKPNNESYIVISVSRQSEARGDWYAWALDAKLDGATRTNNWADQPTVAFDNQAVYLTASMFSDESSVFQYAKIRILNKSVLYSGGTIRWYDFWDLRNPDAGQTKAYSVKPTRNFGTTTVQYLINSSSPFWDCNLTLWSLTDPLRWNPPGPTLTRRSVSVPCYFLPPEAHQPGTAIRVETSDARIWDAVYRDGSIWTAHTIAALWGEILPRAAIRWYQINAQNANVIQQGTYGAKGFYYYFPSVMPDSRGNMVVIFNRSSNTEFVGSYFTGRAVNDPPGELEPIQEFQPGAASYVRVDPDSLINRWGDYNGIALDPDGTTIWLYGMYVADEDIWGAKVGGVSY